jgi:hypothetical protein
VVKIACDAKEKKFPRVPVKIIRLLKSPKWDIIVGGEFHAPLARFQEGKNMANPSAFPITKPVSRYVGALPKIGIRPCIDGRRRGVRESLEEQTMTLAKAAAEFLTQNLRHPCGLPVECVIADTTIGRVAETAACADKFKRENVGVSLTVTPCWCYGSETMDMDPLTPKAIWGFNGTERPGAVVPGGGAGRPRAEGRAGVRHLRP